MGTLIIAPNAAPIPLGDPIARPRRSRFKTGEVDPQEGYLTDSWVQYFSQLAGQVSVASVRINQFSVRNQNGSISATNFVGGGVTAGLYRICFYARVTQQAGTSSSLTVTFGWSDLSTSVSISSSALVANNVSAPLFGVIPMYTDSLSPITIATTYASNPGGAMQYRLDATLEQLAA